TWGSMWFATPTGKKQEVKVHHDEVRPAFRSARPVSEATPPHVCSARRVRCPGKSRLAHRGEMDRMHKWSGSSGAPIRKTFGNSSHCLHYLGRCKGHSPAWLEGSRSVHKEPAHGKPFGNKRLRCLNAGSVHLRRQGHASPARHRHLQQHRLHHLQ